MAFSIVSGFQRWGKNEKHIGKKYCGAPFYFSPNLQPVTLIHSRAALIRWTKDNIYKPQFNLYEEFKGFVVVILYNINK